MGRCPGVFVVGTGNSFLQDWAKILDIGVLVVDEDGGGGGHGKEKAIESGKKGRSCGVKYEMNGLGRSNRSKELNETCFRGPVCD